MTTGYRSATKAAEFVGLLVVLATLISHPVTADHGSILTITTDTTLTADFTGHIVIAADGIILDCAGFSVVGSSTEVPQPPATNYGIFLDGRTGVTVKDCQVEVFNVGFVLGGSSGNTLEGNTARNNSKGFHLVAGLVDGVPTFANDNTLANNTAIDNVAGFQFTGSSGNTLENNLAINNTVYGFTLEFSSDGNSFVNNIASGSSAGFAFARSTSGNTLTGNVAANNTDGFFVQSAGNNVLTGNTAEGNSYIGFRFKGSSDNVLVGNTASGNGRVGLGGGFALDFGPGFVCEPTCISSSFSSNNTLERNTALGNVLGFAFRAADNNTLVNNTVKNNVAGFQLAHMTYCSPCVVRPSTSNTIFRNNIINNTVQVDEVGDNSTAVNDWHHPILEEGNFWSDYNGADDGSGGRVAGDGIGDTLIPHPGPGFDNFPFIDEIVVDSMPPITTATQSGTAGMAGWFTSPVVIQLSAVDDLSGVASTSYRIDEGGWQESTSFMVEGDGIHTIEYFSIDGAGNAETVKSFEVKIDAMAPETSLSVDGTGGENGWYTSPVTTTLTASDATSGIASVTYRIGGAWQGYTSPFSVEGDGVHTVEYYSTDVAGNEEVVNSFDVEIDTTSPSLSISSPVAGEFFATDEVEVTWEAADITSGIDHFEVSMDGETVVLPAMTTSHTFTEVADGAHTVTVIAFDVAGNSVVLSVELTVDIVDTDISAGPDVGLLVGIAVGIVTGAVAVTALLIHRRRANGKTQR